ncbi:unnamed protein product [Adineta steineri]|uniref:Uncharacterized protein n=1 Tax=Adineta steineri TaxID=433720 RepID=A0A815QW41_9BILA|nr:unnamed protein product [Adineta steineri]CAF1635128.1 unnamed protein product [Adineta steineri]
MRERMDNTALSIIFSIVAKTKLQKLCLHDLDFTNNQIVWPIQSTLEYLTIRDCSYHQYRIILCNSPHLRTLIIRNCIMDNNDQMVSSYAVTTSNSTKRQRTSIDSTVYAQLTSLTIGDCRLSIQELECLLSLTPSLGHLKLIASRSTLDTIFDGSYWEQFIQEKLLLLNQFQFLLTCIDNKFDDITTFDSLILPFQSPFWLNNKNWFVTCGYILRESKIILYTTPLFVGVDAATRSAVFEVSLTNPEYRLILRENYNRIYNIEEETFIKLNLEGNPGSSSTTVSAAIQIRNDKTITKIKLCGKSIDDTGMKFLADALINNETITELDLYYNKIGDIGTEYLADALQNNTTLVILKLSYNQIGHNGAKYLSDLLQTNQMITKIDLLKNHIGDIGAQYLANVLQNNPTMTELDLSRNAISDTGVQYLAHMLRKNTVMVTLGLWGNAITDIGAQKLFNSLKTNKVRL